MSYKSWYNQDADYNTNAKSYMDYLARHNKFMKVLVEDYEVFKEILTEEFKQFQLDTDETIESFQTRLDGIKEEMIDFFMVWLEDGTLETIINENIFNGKLDKSEFESIINTLQTHLEGKLDRSEFETSINTLTTQLERKTEHYVTSKELGINNGDDLTEKESVFEALESGTTVIFDRKAVYNCSDGLDLKQSITLDFNGSTVKYNKDTATKGLGIAISAIKKTTLQTTENYLKSQEWLTVNNTTNVSVGDTVFIDSPETYNDSRDYYTKGGTFLIVGVEGNRIKPHRPLPYTMGSGATLTVYESTTGHIKNLNLVNVGTLERGVNGLLFVGLVNSTIENVTVDNFNINVRILKSVNTSLERVTPLRSYYTGSVESYGIALFESSSTSVKNSICVSGRHGISISGRKNSFDTYLENCTFGTEIQTGLAGLDHHDSSFNSTIINCNVHGATLAGNVLCQNVHFNREYDRGKNISLGRGMNIEQCNYTFTDCYFSEYIDIRVSAPRDKPTSTHNRIGKLIIRDCVTPYSSITLLTEAQTNGLNLDLLHITGTNNISLTNLKGQVELLIMEKMVFSTNQSLISTEENAVNISNLVLRDMRLIGGSGLYIRVHRLGKLLMDNIQIAGLTKSIHFTNGGGSRFKATLRNCDFESVENGIRFDDVGVISLNDNEGFINHHDSTYQSIRTAVYD